MTWKSNWQVRLTECLYVQGFVLFENVFNGAVPEASKSILIIYSENIPTEACNDIRWRFHVVGKTRWLPDVQDSVQSVADAVHVLDVQCRPLVPTYSLTINSVPCRRKYAFTWVNPVHKELDQVQSKYLEKLIMMSTWFKVAEVNYKLHCNPKYVTHICDLTYFFHS